MLAAVVALAAASCDKVPLLAPTGATIVLSTSSIVLPTGGTATLTAFVSEAGAAAEQGGTPVQNGTTVRFITDIGEVSPASTEAHHGIATATFTGSASGVATVRALSGSAANPATGGTNAETITIGAAAVDAVAVREAPSSVPASGGTVSVTASVTATSNRPLSGISVAFSSANGTLSAASATTDANGQATVQLTTNRESVVTAAVGGKQGTVNVTLGATASVSLLTGGGTVLAGSAASVTVTPTAGTSSRVVLTWGDGSAASDLGLVSAATAATHVYANPGTFTIGATATDSGQVFTTSIAITTGPRLGPTITAAPATAKLTAGAADFVFTIVPNVTNGVRNLQLDFGDGETVDLGATTATTSISHRYLTIGSKVARVTQTDASGNSSSAVVIVTVT